MKLSPGNFVLIGLAWIAMAVVVVGKPKEDFARSIEALPIPTDKASGYLYTDAASLTPAEVERGIDRLTAIIRGNPQNAEAYRNRAVLYFVKREFDKSIDDSTEALRLDPKDAEACLNRASADFEDQHDLRRARLRSSAAGEN
jgi:tetratricopeptide (TPR) repeat protein